MGDNTAADAVVAVTLVAVGGTDAGIDRSDKPSDIRGDTNTAVVALNDSGGAVVTAAAAVVCTGGTLLLTRVTPADSRAAVVDAMACNTDDDDDDDDVVAAATEEVEEDEELTRAVSVKQALSPITAIEEVELLVGAINIECGPVPVLVLAAAGAD